MDATLFGSELWKPALDKYAEATGLSVELFDASGARVLSSAFATPLAGLFREYGFASGLFAECARRCLKQTREHPVVTVDDSHGLSVVGTSLVLEGNVVGVAAAGYALSRFCQVTEVQRWATSARVPFVRLWDVMRRLAPMPERRLMLHGGLLQVLGDALLRENHRTREYEDLVVKLKAASAAKDTFLAVLSHELRTPLAPIAGWAGVMKNAQSLEQVRRAAGAIERNAFAQARMIDDLLDVTRIAHGTIAIEEELLELSACVGDALEAVGPDIERKSIRAEVVAAPEPLLVKGDAPRLRQVFRNILSNAAKFTADGGRIRIALARDASDARIAFSDTGKGIAPEFLPFAFDIFRQQESGTRRQYAGLGVGLALVRKLVELHNGTVSLSSPGEGRGTEVTVRLPLAVEASRADLVHATEQPGSTSLAGMAILVIDDLQDAREILQILLQHLGANVTVACGGHEALEMLRDPAPDLVLCDLRMPRMDGFEFLAELRRTHPSGRPPVVAVSALVSDLDRQRVHDAGFGAYLRKPYDDATLVAAIEAALHRQLH